MLNPKKYLPLAPLLPIVMKITNQYRLVGWIAASIIFAATFVFFLFYCRYQLVYHGQQQLFQYHSFYFHRLITSPGGFGLYASNFLLHFFYYPWLGALIFAVLLLATYAVINAIFRHYDISGRFALFPLFPAAAYGIMMYDYEFEPVWLLSLVGALFVFAGYIRIPSAMFRYLTGIIALIVLYFFAPAAMLLSGVLFIADELLFTKNRIKYSISGIYLFIVGILPWFSCKILYTTPWSEAYFAGFPYMEKRIIRLFTGFSWLFVPVMLLCIRFFAGMQTHHAAKGMKGWRWPALSLTVLSAFLGCGLYRVVDKRITLMLQMDYEISCENWSEVLRLSRQYSTSNRLVTYYTNIALHKTGQMLDHFFDYRQTGPNGLFLDWNRDYLTAAAGSEVFYHLGFTNEANHWAFEALTASKNGENPRLLKRLVQTAIINEDYAFAEKYLRILKSSLFYRGWAKEHLSLLKDQEHIKNLSWVSEKRSQWVKNDFLSGRKAPANLPLFFDEHPENKMAFEYMMMYYLLTKNISEFMDHIGRTADYDYKSLPAVFEEAVLVYLNMHEADRETYQKYPIKRETYLRFNDYSEVFQAYSKYPQQQKRALLKKFGNTYWYYFHFWMPQANINE